MCSCSLRQYTVISRIACGADIFSNYNSANLKEQFYYEMSIRDILAKATREGQPLSTKADYKEYFARGTVNVNVKERQQSASYDHLKRSQAGRESAEDSSCHTPDSSAFRRPGPCGRVHVALRPGPETGTIRLPHHPSRERGVRVLHTAPHRDPLAGAVFGRGTGKGSTGKQACRAVRLI
jgi:hypothetical protein